MLAWSGKPEADVRLTNRRTKVADGPLVVEQGDEADEAQGGTRMAS